MSEELNEVDNKEVKKKTEPEITENDNSQEIKKKNTSKKVDIIEKYQYIPEANEQLIVDRPTESLKKIDEMKLNNEKNIKNTNERVSKINALLEQLED